MTVEWHLDCLALDGSADLTLVAAPDFVRLEADVVEALKGSWCSDQKARLLLELVAITRPPVCVEVGAFTGSTTLPMLAGLRWVGSGRAFVIDAWSSEEATRGLPADDVNTTWWGSVDMQAVKGLFTQTIARWSLEPWCEVIAEPSRVAAEKIPAIDFLHLDGSFSEQGSLLDSELYLPKVNAGGHVLLSNVLVTVGGKPTKMRALWPLFDSCDILCELDGGNTLLFRKTQV